MSREATMNPIFGAALGRLGPALLASLDALEQTFRHLHPPDFAMLRSRLVAPREALDDALVVFCEAECPEALSGFRDELVAAAEEAQASLVALIEPSPGPDGIHRMLLSMHQFARTQALLYPLRHALPPVSAFFAEAFRHSELDRLEAEPGSDRPVGLFRGGKSGERGGFDLYVPESWDGEERLPLIVALHGGSGSGEDFLWTWLREARSRRCLLLAPTSRGSTWSLNAPEVDGRALRQTVEWLAGRWRVDRERVLLTGLSDGATMSALVGLAEESPFTHLAPISGVLHPLNFAIGNIDRAEGKPIEWVHGALDWMFPVSLAREAARVLRDAGARIRYHEIADLSHTYPREMNAHLIEWLDPSRGVSASA